MARRTSRPKVLLALTLVVILALPALMGAGWFPWASERVIQSTGFGDDPPFDKWAFPAVSGDWAVYQVHDGPTGDWDVLAKNLRTDVVKRCSTVSAGNQTAPQISGSWVVYQDSRHGQMEIYAFDLAANKEVRVTSKVGDQWSPDISGKNISFHDSGQIWVHSLTSGKQRQITTGTADNFWARVSGQRVVYQNGNEIAYFDLTNNTEHSVTTASMAPQVYPDIDGTRVVWQVGGANVNLRGCDLATNDYVDVCTVAGTQQMPDVNGTKVVWMDNRAGNWDVYGFDLVTKKEFKVSQTSGGSVQRDPAISGNNVVWEAGTSGFEGNIVLGSLRAPTLTFNVTTTVAYGVAGKLTGQLTDGGIPLGGRKVAIWRSGNGGYTWIKALDATTDGSGAYSASIRTSKNTRFRALYDGEFHNSPAPPMERMSAISDAKTMYVRAFLGKPSGPKSITHDVTFTTRGYLKPRHTAGTKPVRIQVFKKSSGKYRLKKTYSATVSNYSSYSRYAAKIKLTSRGYWRVRAYYPATATNAGRYSSYRYIYAK